MKFVDEATIRVEAGNGGDGCMSFRREKFIPRGGPNGGNGGAGGNVYLVGQEGLNTLADFRHTRMFRAPHGEKGGSQDCTGRSGVDRLIAVPLGTKIEDAATAELIGEITRNGQQLLVAHGGKGGLGNACFKSSTNRAPRKTTQGIPGDQRELKLELQVLADIGLLGLPNAGKSTLLRQVTQARPKVADYPFTTLHPNLGVVRLGPDRSFVIADIPGLIEGAAEGIGLGIQFLKHLSRTHILLHLVDLLPPEGEAEIARRVENIVGELRKFSPALAERERWLVFNKIDLIDPAERTARIDALRAELGWQGNIYGISAVTGEGCRELMEGLMRRLEELRREQSECHNETPPAETS
ncbi:MAG: GTPase ObgE [Gammaproteobacteria bacterium]|nr:GTPase ObgE [Gammaproteobacteria bacterium]